MHSLDQGPTQFPDAETARTTKRAVGSRSSKDAEQEPTGTDLRTQYEAFSAEFVFDGEPIWNAHESAAGQAQEKRRDLPSLFTARSETGPGVVAGRRTDGAGASGTTVS